jgi:hypothetical protein
VQFEHSLVQLLGQWLPIKGLSNMKTEDGMKRKKPTQDLLIDPNKR